MAINVVVGAGQAGAHAAIAMRRAGFGGRIVLVGDEGALPYERPPLSKGFIASQEEVPLVHFFEPATFAAEAVEVITGVRAEEIDLGAGRLRLGLGGSIPFDRLVLATGSRPRQLTLPGGERALTLRSYADAMRLRARLMPGEKVVCIGAGVIGLEIASSATARGCSVTVVDVEASAMSRFLEPGLASLVRQLHERRGVEFAFSSSVAAIGPTAVALTDGRMLPADLVVAGVGIVRNIELAAQSGLMTHRGILVDPSGRTSHAQVMAAGEVAEFRSNRLDTHLVLESWRHAQDHGAMVGRVAAGAQEEYEPVPWFWSDQHGVNLQFAGDTSGAGQVQAVDRGDRRSDSFATFFTDADHRVVGAAGFNAPKEVSGALRMIRAGLRIRGDQLSDRSISLQRLVADATKETVRPATAIASVVS